MITLGLETATSACAAALWSAAEGRVLAVRAQPMARGLAERLVPLVQELMAEAGLGFADVDRFAACVGPGTFTGLRIGLAAARGFALAAGRPLVGITSFLAVAHGVPAARPAAGPLLACIESRREELFIQPFDAGRRPLAPPREILPAALAAHLRATLPSGPLLLAGDAAARAAAALGDRPDLDIHPCTGAAEAVAVARLAAGLDPAELPQWPADPYYLRPPDVTLPGPKAAG